MMEGSFEVMADAFAAVTSAPLAPQEGVILTKNMNKCDIYLASVVSNVRDSVITRDDDFRCYSSSITTRTGICGNVSTTENIVVYRVGRHCESPRATLRTICDQQKFERVGQRFRMLDSMSTELSGLSRKHSNFSGRFDFADFSAILEYLAASLACYATFGFLRHDDMMNGMPLNIKALAMYDDPVGANEKHIFIPRTVSTMHSSGTFAALVAAANATGSTVATDLVHLDANTNAPVLTVCDGADLAYGCYDAIRILLGIMNDCDAGALGSYAVTRGIHACMTVAGHTDEGGLMRKVLRSSAFAPSFGGVFTTKDNKYIGIASPSKDKLSTFISLVDGMALMTAASVANCDPLVNYEGRWYPTVYGTNELSHCQSVPTIDGDWMIIGRKIAGTCGDFSQNYINELAHIFMLTAGDTAPAVAHMQAAFNSVAEKGDRHLEYTSVAPYYWIEPTSLFKHREDRTLAVKEGFGTLTGVYEDSSMNYFEGMTVVQNSSEQTSVVAAYRSARTCAMILHHYNNVNNGLGAAVIRQAAPINFAHRGGSDETIEASMLRSAPLSDYLWTRGDAGVPAPSELLYTGKSMGLILTHGRFDYDKYEYIRTGLANQSEVCANNKVIISCSTPAFFGIKKVGERPRKMIHSRSLAVAALEVVKTAFRGGAMTGGEALIISFSAPDIVFERDVNTEVIVRSARAPGAPTSMETIKRGPTTATVVEQAPMRMQRISQTGAAMGQVRFTEPETQEQFNVIVEEASGAGPSAPAVPPSE